jgi:DNA-binding Lrp family transcriptional regulator
LLRVILMTVEAYILFKVNSGTEREACEKIARLNEVLLAGIVYGEYDVIARISVLDLQALEAFLSEKIRKVPSVILTSTMIIAREYKGRSQSLAK